jgi:hypothetical protein
MWEMMVIWAEKKSPKVAAETHASLQHKAWIGLDNQS